MDAVVALHVEGEAPARGAVPWTKDAPVAGERVWCFAIESDRATEAPAVLLAKASAYGPPIPVALAVRPVIEMPRPRTGEGAAAASPIPPPVQAPPREGAACLGPPSPSSSQAPTWCRCRPFCSVTCRMHHYPLVSLSVMRQQRWLPNAVSCKAG
jgi:hypothetical protein